MLRMLGTIALFGMPLVLTGCIDDTGKALMNDRYADAYMFMCVIFALIAIFSGFAALSSGSPVAGLSAIVMIVLAVGTYNESSDRRDEARRYACQALISMGSKDATNCQPVLDRTRDAAMAARMTDEMNKYDRLTKLAR